jgi:hypothetical protein
MNMQEKLPFTDEQIQIIKQVILVPYDFTEISDKPLHFKHGMAPNMQVVLADVESKEFPGLPVIGINTHGETIETGHGVGAIDSIRDEIKNRFERLAKLQKKSSLNIIDDSQIYHAPEDKPKSEPDKKLTINACAVCGLEVHIDRALSCKIEKKPITHAKCEEEIPEPKENIPEHGINQGRNRRNAEVMQPQNKNTPAIVEPARIPVMAYSPQGSMIKGFIPSLKEIGKIKIGGKGQMKESAGGKSFRLPVKYDHFEVVSLMRDDNGDFIKDSVMALLEEEPKNLDVFLLFNDPTLNFTTSYNHYQGGKCLCRGDGETAKTIEGKVIECNPDTCQAFNAKKCKPNGILSVILTKSPRLGGVYKFRTTSYNSIRSILSSMFFLSNLTGGVLAMIPLKLTVSPQQVQPKDAAKAVTIFVVNIEFAGTMEGLLQKTFEVQKYQSGMRESIMRLETTARQVLTAPESQEEIKDIEEEFYPDDMR